MNPNTNSKKILLIDDDIDQTAMYGRSLSKSGFEVCVENSANNASAIATDMNPALILLDLIMEGKSGIEVLRELKASSKTKNIPVVMLTNTSDARDIEEVKKIGAAGYWEKTKILPNDLAKKCKKILEIDF